MAAKSVKEDSPLVLYESDEMAGRKAYHLGQLPQDCPHEKGQGGNMRRLAWMRGYYAEKYWEPHNQRKLKDYV